MGNPPRRISYRIRADGPPEAEAIALRNVYSYLVYRAKSKVAEPRKPGDPYDAKGSRHDSRQREYT